MQRALTLIVLLLSICLNVTALQFITGPCQSDADCASSCCGFNSGKCAGPVIAQERDGGCGHGNAQPNDIAAQAFRNGMSAQQSAAAAGGTTLTPMPSSAASAANMNSNSNSNSNNAPPAPAAAAPASASTGTQFITGACTSDADCASGCCGFRSGKCAGPVIAQERDGGCGHGNAQPNADAARAFGFTGAPGSG